VEVRIDEGRRHQPAAGIDDAGRVRRDAAFHRKAMSTPGGRSGRQAFLTRDRGSWASHRSLLVSPTRLDRASTGKRMLIDMEDRVNSAVEILDRLIAFVSLPGETNLDLIAYIRDYLAAAASSPI
jgi:hypothetical protein